MKEKKSQVKEATGSGRPKNVKKKEKKKGPSRRSQVKYPALDHLYTTKVRREYLDMDKQMLNELKNDKTMHRLHPDDPDSPLVTALEYYNQFMEEHLAAFVPKKNPLHNTDELRKDCYSRNNARNRCMYSIARASNLLKDPPELTRDQVENEFRVINNLGATEDATIALIDELRRLEEED